MDNILNTQEVHNYYIINSETNIIENVVVATEDVARQMNLKPVYDNAWIGDIYNPPEIEPELNPDKDTVEYINQNMSDSLSDGINEI